MNRILFIVMFIALSLTLRAEDRALGLAVGATIPDVNLRTEKDKDFNLRAAVAERPAVLIFYRGGWCPFCTAHLSALVGIEKDLTDAGFQLLAISADQPSKLRERPAQQGLNYTLLSDSAMKASEAFGIAYAVSDDTLAKMKSLGVDLEAASGQSHHMLPHPSVFIVDKGGLIRFAHVNPDYKSRLDPAKILEAARGVKQ